MGRGANILTPVVVGGILYSDDAFTGAYVGGRLWFEFLSERRTFHFYGDLSFTARCELRREVPFWYAYKKVDGKLKKRYLGKTSDLTKERLRRND